MEKKKQLKLEKSVWTGRLSQASEKGIPRWIFRSGRQVFRPIKSFPVQGGVLHL